MRFKKLKFVLYRYQLVPVTKKIQQQSLDFGDNKKVIGYEDLIRLKNEVLFKELTKKEFHFYGQEEKINHKIEYSENEQIFMKVNVRKKAKLGTKDFREREEEDYPQSILFFNNNGKHQVLAIQDNRKAFSNHHVIARIVEGTVESILSRYDLAFYLEPLYLESEFWSAIKRYERKITWMRFELIKPNISNISESIKKHFDIIGSDTNSHRTALELHAPDKGVLENVNQNNASLNAIVEYNLNGGGKQPEFRIGKITKKYKTLKSERSVELDDIRIKGRTTEEIVKIFKDFTDI